MPKLRSAFTLGGVSAEADNLLEEAFFQSSDYDVISSREDPRCFLVGRTGSGKSAALNRLEEQHPGHVIRINPENLALPYITNLQLIKNLDVLDVNLDLFWRALWKHVFVISIIRHRYHITSQVTRQNVFRNLRDRISSDPGKRQALDYLENFEDKFWDETNVLIQRITESFSKRFDDEVAFRSTMPTLGFRLDKKSENETFVETHRDEVDKFQRIVNDTQLPRLNTMLSVLNENILDSEQNFTYIVIDDLDREWVDERIANDLIRCLFWTVFDLKRIKNLKVLVALRTNIFKELDFARRSGGQEDKLRALVLDMKWSHQDLETMLDDRTAISAARAGLSAKCLSELLPNGNATMGKPVKYIIDRTLLRPRDAITFANECFAVGLGKNKLAWTDIHAAERDYSMNLLLSLRDEWKGTYPGIDKVVEKFRGSPSTMTKDELSLRLDEAILLLSDRTFSGVRWLTDVSSEMWAARPGPIEFHVYQPLLEVLFSTGLIGCSTNDPSDSVFYYDDPKFVSRATSLDKTNFFTLHRGFHSGLEARDPRRNN